MERACTCTFVPYIVGSGAAFSNVFRWTSSLAHSGRLEQAIVNYRGCACEYTCVYQWVSVIWLYAGCVYARARARAFASEWHSVPYSVFVHKSRDGPSQMPCTLTFVIDTCATQSLTSIAGFSSKASRKTQSLEPAAWASSMEK
jgi:hypothetical protein